MFKKIKILTNRALVLLFVLIALAKVGSSQEDVIRVDTNLVTIPATVLDRDGRYITNLRKEDFQIFEDGIEQEIAFFSPVEQPFTIFFLLDVSGSMTNYMDELARAANSFTRQLRPDDQLTAASFDDWVDILVKATKVGDLQRGIKLKRSRRSPPTTMVYDAVDYALRQIKKIRGRKAIVLFSDGVGSGIEASAKQNLRDAEELDALVYTVQFDTYPPEPPHPNIDRKWYLKRIEDANNYMRDLAQRTGGRHYRLESIIDLEKTFSQVAEELRRQYSLGYYPKAKSEIGQRRQIKVKVRLPNLVIRARDSYIVQPPKK